MTLDETLLSYLGGINNNDLINILDTNLIDNYEPQLIRRSSYYDSDKFTKLTQTKKSCFSVFSTNIQSINSKFNELEAFIEELSRNSFKFNVICLQETWTSENDDLSQFSLHGYDCIAQGKTCSKNGGLIIYVDNNYRSEVKLKLNMYEHWEGLIVQINGGNLSKNITIGNIYRPPRTSNDNLNALINEFSSIVSSLEHNCKNSLIIAGDFNINLLKLNENDMYSSYFDALISHSLFPQITFPTRFTRTNGTLIDNFFCKLSQSMLESTAGILIKKLSDHQPYFMLINTSLKTEPPPKFVKINVLNDDAMHKVKNEIKSYDTYNKLNKNPNADTNLNYDIIFNDIVRAKDKHMPTKLVKFNKYKHKKSMWITQGILRSIQYRDKLYKQLKLTYPNSSNYEIININLKTYNTILKHTIRAAKKVYFENRFNRFKNDIKNTWKVINEFISKKQTNKKLPLFFTDNDTEITDKKDIANKFNNNLQI